MTILDAQREIRSRFVGGHRAGIIALVAGGFLIFPFTELLVRLGGTRSPLSPANSLRQLGMQVAFVLPLSMPLPVPVANFRQNLFYPAMMILLGAHYVPFVFLYRMRMFAVPAAGLVGGGIAIARFAPEHFSTGAWVTGGVLLAFAVVGRVVARREEPGGRA